MNGPVTGADERLRPVEDGRRDWSDAHTFTMWDPASGLFLLARVAVLPNAPVATAGVLAWLGTRPEYAYGHALDEAPLGDWDDLAVAGVRVQELESLRSWEVNLDDGDNGLSLQWHGTSEVVAYPVASAFGAGHYEQACRVVGQATLNGRTCKVERGVGQRDHSWGVRDVAALAADGGWCAVTGFVGTGDDVDERTFDVLDLGALGGHGFVHDGGVDLRVTAVERTLDADADGTPQRADLVLTVEGGRRFTIVGSGHGQAVVVPGGEPHRIHQRLMTFRTDDGLEGYGICEVLAPDRAAPTTP